jgi:glycosyltransferase involved in cell wall biosynthesis
VDQQFLGSCGDLDRGSFSSRLSVSDRSTSTPFLNSAPARTSATRCGALTDRKRRSADVLGAAAALLHPIHFDEPFGLSVVEAMACGTPVVAYRRGSVAEVVDEGATGYLTRDVESSVGAVGAAARLDRAAVHARAAARFGADRMVEDYLGVYEALLMSARTSPSGA